MGLIGVGLIEDVTHTGGGGIGDRGEIGVGVG